MALGDLIIRLGMNAQAFNRGLRKARGGLGAFAQKLGGIQVPMRAIGAIGATMAGGLVFGIKLAAQAEQTQIAFKTLLGSAEAAQSTLSEIEAFAASTPFQFEGLVSTARVMLAMGTNAADLLPHMRILGDATAALGGNSEVMDSIARALGQMSAKGKVSAEEMNQLAERGIPAWQLLADKIGISIPEAMARAQAGSLSAAEALPALLDGLNERFAGAMDDLSDTVLGKWSTMIDTIKFALRDIGAEFIKAFEVKSELGAAIESMKTFAEWTSSALGFLVMIPITLKRLTLHAVNLMGHISGNQNVIRNTQAELDRMFDAQNKPQNERMAKARDAQTKIKTEKDAAAAKTSRQETIRKVRTGEAGPLRLKKSDGSNRFNIDRFEGDLNKSISPEEVAKRKRVASHRRRLAFEKTSAEFEEIEKQEKLGMSVKRGPSGFAEAGTAKAFSAIQASLRGARDPQVAEQKLTNQKLDSAVDALVDINDSLSGLPEGVLIS